MRCWPLTHRNRRTSTTMSRRKQSNPKPHKPGEDSGEWTTNEEDVRPNAADTTDKTCVSDAADVEELHREKPSSSPTIASEPEDQPQPPPPPPPPPPVAVANPPTRGLRLNPNLATDPGRIRMPVTDEPSLLQILQAQQQGPSSASSSSSTSSLTIVPEQQSASHNVITLNSTRTVQIFVCAPCGIRFSSMSTLDAHQTYYCSRRHKKDSEPDDTKGPIVIDVDDMGLCNDSDSRPSSVEPSAKSIRTGKQYKCPHCSYSADKKVSLNRHMRMHSVSPVSVQSPPCGQPAADAAATDQSAVVDRYCQNCDIRFSNLRTYQAHKTHYCNTRHVVKPTPTSSPMSSQNNVNNNVVINNQVRPTHLALPTNPVIVVPYAFVQNASVISAMTADGGPTPPADTACIVLPNGTLQPIAQARGMPAVCGFNAAGSENSVHQQLQTPSGQRDDDDTPSPTGKTYSPPEGTEAVEPKRAAAAHPSSPLDLRSQKRLREDASGEEEKENRRTDGNVTDAEDIVCAPSIPCMIMLQSPSSSPTPPPPPGRKTPQQQQQQPSSANGVIRKPRTPVQEMVVETNCGGGFSVSSILRYSGEPAESIVKHEFSAAGGSPQSLAVVPSSYFPPEISLRLQQQQPANQTEPGGGVAGTLQLHNQPFFVKQMPPSKCESCNIVFCKYENYLAHKKHYCASRPAQQRTQVVMVVDDDDDGDDGKARSPGDEAGGPGKLPPKAARRSPQTSADYSNSSSNSNSSSSVSPTPVLQPRAPLPMVAVLQFACPTCGVRFSSFDNLSTHQAYYCPNRLTVVVSGQDAVAAAAGVQTAAADKSPTTKFCPKCKVQVAVDQNHQCQTAVANCWKCPVCTVICSTASAAQKHLDTHNGIKAFVCMICNYKGNTLRGLRTHIRMHFNKKLIPDLMEEDYVSCVMVDPRHPAAASAAKSPPAIVAAASSAEDGAERRPPEEQPPPSARVKQEEPSLQNGGGGGAAGAFSDDGEPSSAAADPEKRGKRSGDGGGGSRTPQGGAAKCCKACGISFKYLSTFIAHKKYYCRKYKCGGAENATTVVTS